MHIIVTLQIITARTITFTTAYLHLCIVSLGNVSKQHLSDKQFRVLKLFLWATTTTKKLFMFRYYWQISKTNHTFTARKTRGHAVLLRMNRHETKTMIVVGFNTPRPTNTTNNYIYVVSIINL